MGLGYKLNAMIRWSLPPVQTPLSCSSSPFSCSSSSRGKEVYFDTSKLSFTTVIPDDNEMARKDCFVTHSCLSSFPRATEIDYSNPETTTRKRSRKDSLVVMNNGQTGRTERDKSVTLASTLAYNKSHYQLLMESVHVLEDRISSSNSIDLERNILIQLGRLGALELFRKCLSRTIIIEQPNSCLCYKPNELIGDSQKETSAVCDVTNVIVHSRKKGRRSLRRENPLQRVEKLSSESLQPAFLRSSVSNSSKKKMKAKSRKEMIARNEAGMACGVKVVANLERIRTVMEKETGREVSLSSWAEAAGIDKKMLQQRLKFGWQCRDELIKSARSLVLFLAKSYRGLGIAHEDIIQAGNIGVLQGAERFDHTRGYQFSTYVQYWIRKAMSMLVARHSRGIKIPATLGLAISRIQKARKALQLTCGEHPDDTEIAKFTGLSMQKIESASKCLRVVGSTDHNIGDWSSAKFSERTLDITIDSPERMVVKKHMRSEIARLLSELDQKERQVIVLRFGFGGHQCKSLHEVGKLFNVSKEWIRRVEKRALTKLRVEENKRNLKHYIDI